MKILKRLQHKSRYTGAITYALHHNVMSYATTLPYTIEVNAERGTFYVETSICGLGAHGEDLWELVPSKMCKTWKDAINYIRENLEKYGVL